MLITDIYIVDWYDDIITSIVSLDNNKFILNCIRKNFTNKIKTYYCVKIDEDSFNKIVAMIDKKNLSKKDWSTINLTFKENNKDSNVFLLETESLKIGSNIILKEANSLDIIDIKLPFDISYLYYS